MSFEGKGDAPKSAASFLLSVCVTSQKKKKKKTDSVTSTSCEQGSDAVAACCWALLTWVYEISKNKMSCHTLISSAFLS